MEPAISYNEMVRDLKNQFDKVCRDHSPLLVRRKDGENVVIIAEDDFNSLKETAYLSQSPRNLKRLLDSINRREGKSLAEVKDELGL